MVNRGFNGEDGSFLVYIRVIMTGFMYAIGDAYARGHFHSASPAVVAAGQIICADLLVYLPVLALELPEEQYISAATLGDLLWLGLLGTYVARILYFYVLINWGTTRTTLVTYMIPAVGIAVRVRIPDKMIDWRLLVGGRLILSGVPLVNCQPNTKRIRTS
jgi:drug/metabolite transporter (DMT)-like permease